VRASFADPEVKTALLTAIEIYSRA